MTLRMRFLLLIPAVIALGGLVGCGNKPQAEPGAAPTAPAAAAAQTPANAAATEKQATTIWVSRCVTCHGEKGLGDGAASLGLVPPPRNFSDPAWQASVTDEHIEKIIMYGGSAVGKSPGMPPNPDLMAKKDVVAALRAHVRSLSKPQN
ncbi:MAG: cytochrome c [Thermoanaerobaculia bacterium]